MEKEGNSRVTMKATGKIVSEFEDRKEKIWKAEKIKREKMKEGEG